MIEVNSSPGLQGIETATKLDIAGKIIEAAEKKVAKDVKDKDKAKLKKRKKKVKKDNLE